MELKNYLRKQKPMRRVLLALVPAVAGGVYFFGWRSLVMVLVACAAAWLFEWLFTRQWKEPATEAAFVTGTLLALIVTPSLPFHVLIIGVGVAVIITKMLFGGFGRNLFNPAMVGRCFLYICFPVFMTAYWTPNITDQTEPTPWYGAMDRWSTANVDLQPGSDVTAVTGATPLAELKDARMTVDRLEGTGAEPEAIAEGQAEVDQILQAQVSYRELFFGTLGGPVGATSVLLISIGGIYLFWTKTASRTIILSTVLSYFVFTHLLYLFGVAPVPHGLVAVMGGGFLFGAFYMATDPVSAPKTEWGRGLYGVIIGLSTMVIRNFSVFNGGFMFSLLLANMFAPLLDHGVNAWKKRGAPGKSPLTGPARVTRPTTAEETLR